MSSQDRHRHGRGRRWLVDANQQLGALGLDPVRAARAVRAAPQFLTDLRTFRRREHSDPPPFPLTRLFPCLNDAGDAGGTARGHYFHQDLLVAQRIFRRNPKRHLDVGSRVDGFVAHVASFRAIEVVDIRPTESSVENIHFNCFDITDRVPEHFLGQFESVSCLHALEHFGLGRYGDPIDPTGHIKGLVGLTSLLPRDGTLYLSVPMGPQRLEFNSTRVFSLRYLLDIVKPDFVHRDFSFVDDSGDLHESITLTPELIRANCDVWYGCAILELQKR